MDGFFTLMRNMAWMMDWDGIPFCSSLWQRGFVYEYEMRYITRRGLRREEEEEEKDGMGKTRQGKAGALYDTCILYIFFYPLVLLTFPILFSVEGGPGKKAKRER